jgi:hypothetical protein
VDPVPDTLLLRSGSAGTNGGEFEDYLVGKPLCCPIVHRRFEGIYYGIITVEKINKKVPSIAEHGFIKARGFKVGK